MKDIAAIVEPAIDIRQLSRDIAREHIALQDIDRKLEANQAQGDSLRARQRQHQLEMGRLLIEAKKQTPHGGWLPFLEKLGISTSSSDRWRDLAKHVEIEFPEYPGSGNLPSHREVVAAARREPEPVDDEPDDQDDEPDETKPDPPQAKHPLIITQSQAHDHDRSIDVVLTSLFNTLGVVAREWPEGDDYSKLILELRRYADKLERRSKES